MNKDEFRILFDKYFKLLRNYMYYRCGDAELATDIAQETFMRVWEKNLDVYIGKEMGLLVKIANDLFISSHRKMQSGQKFQKAFNDHQETPTPEDELNYGELAKKYEQALSNMNENQRVVFLMSRHQGLKYNEIAEQLGIGTKAVEKRMSLALEYFRGQLL